jgi:hypothetical protein
MFNSSVWTPVRIRLWVDRAPRRTALMKPNLRHPLATLGRPMMYTVKAQEHEDHLDIYTDAVSAKQKDAQQRYLTAIGISGCDG